jgi:outer membrane protein assembly factor BamB
MRFSVNCAVILVLSCHMTMAAHWGHWRGPLGNGVATDAAPPTEWSSTKNVRWKVELPGRENSSPVVWEDRVFVTTAQVVEPAKDGKLPKCDFIVMCLNRKDGSVLWKNVATTAIPHQGVHTTTGFASASPCTDGEFIFAHFGSLGLYCYTMDGKLVWKRDDFGQMDTLNSFGEGSSPTISGDTVLVPWDHQGPSALYALNRRTGETIWKQDRDEKTCWATPLVVDHKGNKQVIMNGQNFARSYDLETGKELWRCKGQTVRPVATPVASDGLVYIGSGFQGAFMGAFRLDGTGDIEGTPHVAWIIKQDTPDMASPLLTSGRMFFYKRKTALLSCIDPATGKFHYAATRIPGLDETTTYASPVAAGGNVYLTGTNGTTVVIKDSDELNIVATNSLDEFIGGTPAVVDKELFIRGEKHLYCIAE